MLKVRFTQHAREQYVNRINKTGDVEQSFNWSETPNEDQLLRIQEQARLYQARPQDHTFFTVNTLDKCVFVYVIENNEIIVLTCYHLISHRRIRKLKERIAKGKAISHFLYRINTPREA